MTAQLHALLYEPSAFESAFELSWTLCLLGLIAIAGNRYKTWQWGALAALAICGLLAYDHHAVSVRRAAAERLAGLAIERPQLVAAAWRTDGLALKADGEEVTIPTATVQKVEAALFPADQAAPRVPSPKERQVGRALREDYLADLNLRRALFWLAAAALTYRLARLDPSYGFVLALLLGLSIPRDYYQAADDAPDLGALRTAATLQLLDRRGPAALPSEVSEPVRVPLFGGQRTVLVEFGLSRGLRRQLTQLAADFAPAGKP